MEKVYKGALVTATAAMEKGILPDAVVRKGIRSLLSERLVQETAGGKQAMQERKNAFVAELKTLPIAIETDAANEQHYEVPTAYFLKTLGPRLKYSSCLYPEGSDGRPSTTAWKDYDLGKAEDAIFELYCERASLVDGMNILELGCGWGSLSLFLAAKYPNSKVTGVSNSRTQKEFIMKKAKEEGIDKNLTIITANMVEFEPPEAGKYDRMMTVECFEHMKNYEKLFGRVSTWLKPGGKAFIHVFSHKDVCYHFEVKDESDWMTKYFFTGGTMPSHDLFLYFQSANFKIAGHWFLNGRHYANTLHAWLAKQDAAQAELMPVFEEAYGSPEAAKIWWHRWRVFYIACEELFAFGGGDEWGVSLFLFEKPE